MITALALDFFFKKKKDEIDVSEHLDLVTDLSLYIIVLLAVFFVIRFDLWRRLFLDRVDPRPAALMRIAFGGVLFWAWMDLGLLENNLEFLFTDQGLWLTDTARSRYGGPLKTMWDPEMGFEHWTDFFKANWGRGSFLLHYRSDPPFVYTVYGVMMLSLSLMILGWRTRLVTIVAWFLVESMYRYSPIFYTGGDTVARVFLFLGLFARWGEAYSMDAWRRRRKAVLRGARTVPALRRIPGWPYRLMFLQLAIIYTATGMLKSGKTWVTGESLYYALNLDHFYRWPQTGVVGAMHFAKILPASAIFVHWWEILFPVALLGLAINAYERERRQGIWAQCAWWRRLAGYLPILAAWGIAAHIAGIGAWYYLQPENPAPWGIPRDNLIQTVRLLLCLIPPLAVALYLGMRRFLPRVFDFVRLWVLGKRFWLVMGLALHIGIDVGMNVGTFAEVMTAVYFCWLRGEEVEAFWRLVYSRRCPPGRGGRRAYERGFFRELLWSIGHWLARPWKVARLANVPFVEWVRYREAGTKYTVLHNPNEASVRRAALLRCFDLGERLVFMADPDTKPEELRLQVEGSSEVLTGADAGRMFVRIFPAFWALYVVYWLPALMIRLGRKVPALGSVGRAVGNLFGAFAMKVLRQR